MKVNINQPIKGYDGTEIADSSFKGAIIGHLNIQEERQSLEDKVMCFEISSKCANADQVEFDDKERLFIIGKLEKHATPLVLGRVKELLKSD